MNTLFYYEKVTGSHVVDETYMTRVLSYCAVDPKVKGQVYSKTINLYISKYFAYL